MLFRSRLPAASRLAEVTDHRFHQHATRWSICDNCETYCTGRARDYLPGSFVYASDNSHAGPPMNRGGCFPPPTLREDLWRNGTWNARYLCRTCLVREWEQSPQEIDQWLTLHHPGAARAAAYQWRASYNSRSAWHGQWGNSSHGRGWNYSSGKWKQVHPHLSKMHRTRTPGLPDQSLPLAHLTHTALVNTHSACFGRHTRPQQIRRMQVAHLTQSSMRTGDRCRVAL